MPNRPIRLALALLPAWSVFVGCLSAGDLRADLHPRTVQSWSEIYALGEVCKAVYEVTEFETWRPDGLTVANGWVCDVYEIEASAGRAMVLTSDARKQQIVVYRGTDNSDNVMSDCDMGKAYDDELRCHLHAGFAAAARQAWELIHARIERSYALTFTGHSLGGAMAVITAMLATQQGYHVDRVVTFGQPMVTNYEGAVYYDTKNPLPLTRVVHATDSVPLLPFTNPLDAVDDGTFWHFGAEIHYDMGGGSDDAAPRETLLTSAQAHASGKTSYWYQLFTFDRFPVAGLVDHPMFLYLGAMLPRLTDDGGSRVGDPLPEQVIDEARGTSVAPPDQRGLSED
jgi:hypothetical protein